MILFGLKGIGKSYFGQKFAAHVGKEFIDTDTLLGNPRALFHEVGEKVFRQKEEEVIASLKPGGIIAVGGGAMLSVRNRRRDLGPLVYLFGPKELLRERHGDALFDFETAYKERSPLYETLSPYKIDIAKKTDTEVLDALWEIYSAQSFV